MAIHYWLCQCEERLNRNVSMSKSPRRIMDRKWLASHSVISDSYQQQFSASAVIPRPADSSTISTACLQLKVLFLELLVFGMCLFQLHFPLFKRARSRLCPPKTARLSKWEAIIFRQICRHVQSYSQIMNNDEGVLNHLRNADDIYQ